MATYSGGFDNSGYTLYLDVSESNVSIANNTSVVNWTLRIVSTKALQYGSWDWDGAPYSVTIDGSVVASGSKAYDFRNYQSLTIASGSKTITHNSDGSRSVSCSAYFGGNGTPIGDASASGTFALSKIPRYATSNQSLKEKTETLITMDWSSDSTIDYIWYSKDNGSNWTGIDVTDGKSGSYTISNLSANTTYNIKTRVRRKDSQLTTDSSALAVTTYDYPHCTESPNFTIGNSATMKVYNPLSRSITITMVGADGSTKTTESFSGTSLSGFSNTDWQNFWYASIPKAKSGAYQVKVNYGSIVKTRNNGNTYSVKGTETPTVGSISYEDSNSTTVAITGDNQHIVQNKSNLKVTYTKATPKNSASISKYTFTLNGVTKESTSAGGTIDFGAVNSSDNLTLTMVVTDSRGLNSSTTKTITILEHSNPNAIVTLNRLNNYEDESYLTVDGSISSVNSKNTMTIKYRYKVSDGNYNEFTTIKDNEKQTLSLDKNNIYIFNVVVTDAFGTSYDKEHSLGKGVFPLFIDTVKNSVGINALPRTNNVLEVAGRIIESEKEFSIPLTIGSKTGWYLAMSGSFGYVTNKVFLISIQQVFSGGAGLLYLNMRNDDNGLKIQRFEWLTQNGISSSNIKLKIQGNSFYLYLKTTANYQQYYLKVIQEKELGGWGFQQYKMYSPSIDDTVEEPTGTSPTDFIQTTSTNDGTVIKYPDGTMIINQKYSTTVQSSNWVAWGSLYSAKLNTPPNFPVAFVGNKPTVIQTLETDSANGSLCTQSEGTSISSLTRAGASQVVRPTNPGSTAIFTVHITATGRWK